MWHLHTVALAVAFAVIVAVADHCKRLGQTLLSKANAKDNNPLALS
jgi:hypothetical protein